MLKKSVLLLEELQSLKQIKRNPDGEPPRVSYKRNGHFDEVETPVTNEMVFPSQL